MNTRQKIEFLGGVCTVAKMLGISSSAVSQWKEIPVQRAVEIEIKTDGRYSRAWCRPDLFGPLDQEVT